jgi:hypothetical protein
MSDYLEAAALNYIYRGVAWTPAGTLYAAAYTATASLEASNGTANEVTGGGYARVALIKGTAAWNAPGAGGLIDNISVLNFGTATASWGTITTISLIDTSSGTGNLYMYGDLTASKAIASSDIFQIAAGDLDLTFA